MLVKLTTAIYLLYDVLTLKIDGLKAQDHKRAYDNDKYEYPSKDSFVLKKHFQIQ
jgi:hypothetical protein